MKQKVEVKEMAAAGAGGLFWMIAFWLGCMLLQGCTLHMGVDWNGETSLDKRTYTDKKK